MTGDAAQKELWEELRNMAAPELAQALSTHAATVPPGIMSRQVEILPYQTQRSTPESKTLVAFCTTQAQRYMKMPEIAAPYLQTAAFHTPVDDTAAHDQLAQQFRMALETITLNQGLALASAARTKLPLRVPLAFEAAVFTVKKITETRASEMMLNVAREAHSLTAAQQERLIPLIHSVSFTSPHGAAAAFRELAEAVPFDSPLAKRIDAALSSLSGRPAVKFEDQRQKFGMVFMMPADLKPR
jgi:hypothetical protein